LASEPSPEHLLRRFVAIREKFHVVLVNRTVTFVITPIL